jgi:predicted methyltransferase
MIVGPSHVLQNTAFTLLSLTLAAAGHADGIDEAILSPERPAADRERDANSQPEAVLRFFGVPAGGVAVDLFAGGGYYSEILSRAMGPEGTVYMHNNQAYLGFAGDAADQRLENDRLPNVVRYDRELDAIDLAHDTVDLVLMVMTYHDLYFKTDEWDIDADAFFETIHRILKPGGVLAIVDHEAVAGSGSSAAQDLHRIDPAYARTDIERHGFKLVGTSDLLESQEDPLDLSVFDPAIQGKTSKFLFKFVEPGG